MAQNHVRNVLGHLVVVGDLSKVVQEVSPFVVLFSKLGS